MVTEFREGKTRVLIATDVLSRGFDVQQVGRSLLKRDVFNSMRMRVDFQEVVYAEPLLLLLKPQ